MSVIVGSKEIRWRQVFGAFKKFAYVAHSKHCPEGVVCYVYCYKSLDFIRLLAHWTAQAARGIYKEMGYYYTLTLNGYDGEDIALTNIPADNNFKVKVLLHDSIVGVSYIQ